MNTQKDINDTWTQSYQSNVGPCTLLVAPRRADRPKHLTGPYDYEMPVAKARALVKNLNAYLKSMPNAFQYAGADSKGTKYGMRFGIFVLSFRPGLISDQPHKGITMLDWDLVAATIRLTLRTELGVAEVPLYVEPWDQDNKFQMRFETYIKFTEL